METPQRTHPYKTLSFDQVAQPGVMISNAWPQSRKTEGATARAVEEVLVRHPFFEAFQTVDVPFAAERRAIRQLLRDRGRFHNYTLTRVFAEQNVSLSSLDPENRRRAVAATEAQFEHAAEAGAHLVTVISGPRPEQPQQRLAALDALEDSMMKLASAIGRYPGLQLVIEALDYACHKCNTLGTTAEAVSICRHLRERKLPLALCLDTAHLILNGEDSVEAVDEARDEITEFHFCNCVTDRSNPLFGDRHLPFGPPGVLGPDEIATIMGRLVRIDFLAPTRRPRVYCEVLQSDNMTSLEVVAHCEETLVESWDRARRELDSAPPVADAAPPAPPGARDPG